MVIEYLPSFLPEFHKKCACYITILKHILCRCDGLPILDLTFNGYLSIWPNSVSLKWRNPAKCAYFWLFIGWWFFLVDDFFFFLLSNFTTVAKYMIRNLFLCWSRKWSHSPFWNNTHVFNMTLIFFVHLIKKVKKQKTVIFR